MILALLAGTALSAPAPPGPSKPTLPSMPRPAVPHPARPAPPARPQMAKPAPPPVPVAPRAPAMPTIGQGEIRVVVNGQRVKFDVPPMMGEGGVYVPLRGVFEQIGATVDFDRTSGQVTAHRGATTVELKVGSKLAKVDGETSFMVQPALYKDGRTLVPLRFLSQALGATVDWNPVSRQVDITAAKAERRKPAH